MNDPYSGLAKRFTRSYETLRGAIRYEQVWKQLAPFLPESKLRVIDIGGGAGHQAIRFARAGHEVWLVDPSVEMLRRAKAAIKLESESVQDRLTLLQAYGSDVMDLLPAGSRFDAVVCQGVLMYEPEPEPLLDKLAELMRADAVLSIVAKNQLAMALRPALQGRWADAARSFDLDRDVGGLGVETRADSPDELSYILKGLGVDTLNWYGVRVLTDHRMDEKPGGDFEDVLAAEMTAGARDPYRQIGRLFHLVGRKG